MLATGFELDLIRKSWRIQRGYNWDIFLPDMGILSGMDIGRYCQDISFGDYSMNEIVAQRYGPYQSKFAGLFSIEDVTFTFLKPVPDVVSAFWYYWRSLMVSLAGYYNVKSQYAKTIKIFMYDTNGAVSNTINLIGVFPKSVPSYRMAYGREEMVQMTITCSVDRFSVGDYVAPNFPKETEQPVVRTDYAVVIGNDLPQKVKEPNYVPSSVSSYAESRQFSTADVTVPNPVPDPELRWSTAGITIGTKTWDGLRITVPGIIPDPEERVAYAPSVVPTPKVEPIPIPAQDTLTRYGISAITPQIATGITNVVRNIGTANVFSYGASLAQPVANTVSSIASKVTSWLGSAFSGSSGRIDTSRIMGTTGYTPNIAIGGLLKSAW